MSWFNKPGRTFGNVPGPRSRGLTEREKLINTMIYANEKLMQLAEDQSKLIQ